VQFKCDISVAVPRFVELLKGMMTKGARTRDAEARKDKGKGKGKGKEGKRQDVRSKK